MTLMTVPLQGLIQQMLSSVKVGWGADRGRINLTASDALTQRWSVSEVHCATQMTDIGRRAVRIGFKEADRHLLELAQRLFGTGLASFNAHNGQQANRAVFKALLQPGEPVTCLADPELEGVLDTLYVAATTARLQRTAAPCHSNGLIDYERLASEVATTRPRCIVAGYTAYTRHLDYQVLRKIADSVGASLVIDVSRVVGLIAAGLLANPLPYADVITGATHKSLQGPRGGFFMTREPALYQKFCESLHGLGHLSIPHRLKLALINSLRQADAPLQVARQQLSMTNARAMARAFSDLGLRVHCAGTDVQTVALDLRPLAMTHQQAAATLARLGVSVERRESTHLLINTFPVSARGMDAQACHTLATALGSCLLRHNELKTVAQGIGTIDRLCTDHPPLATAMDHLNLQ
ncbi:beta-eliminating lyase-related protein [Pseudomonas putida]|uniref:beta-eliminating lyase-related protein n=1 Tax=Pseudomonas putida TaxID=303 RepID=UPI0023632835|nr:beta-eliminating lyase-related protein [Pseudomonas putida]MDD2002030.1 beta-eliminating lyase-related protein [Pseudomonas putida]